MRIFLTWDTHVSGGGRRGEEGGREGIFPYQMADEKEKHHARLRSTRLVAKTFVDELVDIYTEVVVVGVFFTDRREIPVPIP